MNESISLKELIAAIFRRGRLAVLFVVVFGLLFGSYRAYSLYSKSRNQGSLSFQLPVEVYDEALDSYEREKRSLESSLSSAKDLLKGQYEYLEKSLLMKVNPYSEWVSFVQLGVSDVSGTPQNVSPERAVEQIEQQYLLLFQCSDLQDKLDGYSYSSYADMYIREMISFSMEEGGTLLLQTAGATEEDAKQLADSLLNFLMESNEAVSEASYKHKMILLSQLTKTVVDDELIIRQNSATTSVDTTKKRISSLEAQINSLVKPTLVQGGSTLTVRSLIRSTIKYTLLGCVAGGLIDCIVVIFFLISGRSLEYPSHFGKAYSIPYLGTLKGKTGLFDRICSWILDEQTWDDLDKAGAYVSQTANVLLEGTESIGILTTLPIDESDASVQAAIKALDSEGRKVSFVGSAAQSTETPKAIRNMDKLVLMERKGKSRLSDMTAVVNLAEAVGNPIAGYIVI